MPSKSRRGAPTKATIRAYQVGFGDCFLLSFHYPAMDRHVLIDFGTRKLPKGMPARHMQQIAEDIRKRCNGKLHAVVATHRHQDHISGFATAAGGKGPGDVIASCNPDRVVQPWTEHPDAAIDAKTAPLTRSLRAMRLFAASAVAQAAELRGVSSDLRSELAFTGENNVQNPSAVRNLQAMGRARRGVFVHAGSPSELEAVLPGVKVHVLGPPTLEQSAAIRKERRQDPEFWGRQKQLLAAREAFWNLQLRTADSAKPTRRLFPRAPTAGNRIYARWIRRQLHEVRGENLLELVRILDAAMNNTSVILLFEAGNKLLLFPGDAQIENWSFALSQKPYEKLLRGVHVYKVGHHGSTNATPRLTLWGRFANAGAASKRARLQTVLSTLPGVFPGKSADTAVPQPNLMRALRRESALLDTEGVARGELSSAIEIALA